MFQFHIANAEDRDGLFHPQYQSSMVVYLTIKIGLSLVQFRQVISLNETSINDDTD